MKVTVCELPDEPADLDRAWEKLVAHAALHASDFVLLPEMPFYRWLPWTRNVDPDEWQRSVRAHERWIDRLAELGSATVASSRPVVSGGRRQNVGFIWNRDDGAVDVHAKHYLPDEREFWEATWYGRGDGDFSVVATPRGSVGFLICTELWFGERAREYGRQGAQLVLCPRATPAATGSKWLAGGRTAAVVSGAFCLSSNRAGTTSHGMRFAGIGWVAEPEEGEIIARTSAEDPYVTVDVDLQAADRAKSTYPRYVDN